MHRKKENTVETAGQPNTQCTEPLMDKHTLQPRKAKHGRLDVDVLNVKQIDVERAHRHPEHHLGGQFDEVDAKGLSAEGRMKRTKGIKSWS